MFYFLTIFDALKIVFLKWLSFTCRYQIVNVLNEIAKTLEIIAIPKHEMDQRLSGASYVFSYHITIVNRSAHAVQLLRRHWFITDGLFGEREVEGEGVIGQQPKLKPGEKFEYESWCPLSGDYGTMNGFFTFCEVQSRDEFEVDVPAMVLLPKFALN